MRFYNKEHTLISAIMGAFLWDDSDQDQWSEITRIMVDQMNRWIHYEQGFIGLFDLQYMIRAISDHWSWYGSSQRNAPYAYSTKSFRLSTENNGIFWLKQAYNFLNQLPIVAY